MLLIDPVIRLDDITPFRTIKDKKVARKLTEGDFKVATIKDISCSELIKVFGYPTFYPEDLLDSKSSIEWVVRFTRGFPLMEGIFRVYFSGSSINPLKNLEERYNFGLASKDVNDNIVKGFVSDMLEYLVK